MEATDQATQLVRSSRLVTLTGAPGCGKVRLALRVASEAAPHYPDGVHWIEQLNWLTRHWSPNIPHRNTPFGA